MKPTLARYTLRRVVDRTELVSLYALDAVEAEEIGAELLDVPASEVFAVPVLRRSRTRRAAAATNDDTLDRP
ncbi:MAG: hypothetical protein ACHREM_14695 [Polyangiales bacterium]